MSVFRINKNNDYTTMSNYHLKDKRLTLKAKGLLSVMLSLSNEWNYSVAGLCSISKENETAINSALKELKDCGYLIVSKERGIDGKFEYSYDIFERPTIEKPDMDKPGMENMGVANNINNINNNEVNTKDKKLNNNKESIINNTKENPKRFKKPTLEELQAYINEKGYHFNAENFINYYDSVGWKIGKSPMKDWKAACRTWEAKYKNDNNGKCYKPKEISRETAYPEFDDVGYIR